MNAPLHAQFELRAEIFKALAHPMRLLLLEKIRERPRCVCDLATEIGLDKSVASKYLSQLRNVGLIDDRRHGALVEYHLIAPCVLEMAACAEKAIVDFQQKKLGAATARSTGS